MSFEAVLWATSDAPIADVNEFAVLVMLAEKADPDGCNTFPSRPTMASRTRVDSRTVLRCLQRLEERRLIAKGDQRAAAYIRADRRPVVYDLLIPYSWFPNIERINKERQERGRPPLTPADRPDIAPPPEKVRRSDIGKKRSPSRGVSQSPRKAKGQNGHGVSLSPPRGVSQSATGCLTDTRTSPLNQSNESLSPVGGQAEDARGRASVKETRETMASPKDKPTTALPSQRAGQTPQQPQEATQKPATTAERIVRKTGLVRPDEEAAFIKWATARHKPKHGGWWSTVAKQGDLPSLVADWRATQQPAAASTSVRHGLPTWCGVCNDGVEPRQTGHRMRWTEEGRLVKCEACHPGTILRSNVNTQQPDLPPHCGDLDCDERTRLRGVEDESGFQVLVPCPECHPSAVQAAVPS